MLRRIQQALLIDRPLFYALAARIWQALSGPITITLILSLLTASETGIYYSLGAVVGIQAFFELGLLNVLVSQAGYAISSKPNSDSETAKSERIAKESRMSELIRVSERWFFMASLIFGLSALALGWTTLGHVQVALDWKTVLVVLTAFSATTFALAPTQAILEGAGKREVVYRFRLYQAVTGSLTVWISLILGLKLWALVTSVVIQVSWMVYLRYFYEAEFFAKYRRARTDSTDFSWLRDIVPVQWRMAILSLAYFLATQLLIVIVLYYDSDVAAGQLGITLNIVNAIQMFALAWIQTSFSTAAIQHGSGDREAAGTHWRRLAFVSTAMLALMLTILIVLISILPWLHHGFENRFVTPWQLSIYSVGCLANHLIAIQSFYVLSQRARPFTWISSVGFLVTAIAVWFGGANYGITGLLYGYAITMALVSFPLHTWAYLRFRQLPR